MRQLRADAPAEVMTRLGLFLAVLAVATGAGWGAGQSVGPVRVPDDAAVHGHAPAAP